MRSRLAGKWVAKTLLVAPAIMGCDETASDPKKKSTDASVADTGEVYHDAGGGSRDAGDARTGDDCEAAEASFQAFLSAHRSCEVDADCTTVGDCGPHIWHEPVNIDAANEARRLQLETCAWGFDGETDGTVCENGACVRVPLAGKCCGCDAGHVDDAGDDAGH